jgi:hypothetical protein
MRCGIAAPQLLRKPVKRKPSTQTAGKKEK